MSSKKFYTDPKVQEKREKLLDEMSNTLHNDANKADRQFKIAAVILLLGGLIYFFI